MPWNSRTETYESSGRSGGVLIDKAEILVNSFDLVDGMVSPDVEEELFRALETV